MSLSGIAVMIIEDLGDDASVLCSVVITESTWHFLSTPNPLLPSHKSHPSPWRGREECAPHRHLPSPAGTALSGMEYLGTRGIQMSVINWGQTVLFPCFTACKSECVASTINWRLSSLHQGLGPFLASPPAVFVSMVAVAAMAAVSGAAQRDVDPNVESPVAWGANMTKNNQIHCSLQWLLSPCLWHRCLLMESPGNIIAY